MRSNRVAFRRAVIASAAIHVALAVAVLLVARSGGEAKKPAPPGIDTRADDVVLRAFLDGPTVPTQPPPDVPPASPPSTPPTPTGEVVEDVGGSRPLAQAIAPSLSPELLAIVRRQVSATQPIAITNATPAVATSTLAIHGAMKANQSVVYVLDCSGSMGEFGKFATARAALVVTLRGQPEGLRFQVIAYNSTARAVLAPGLHPATAANIDAAETKLLTLAAAGRSSHAEAVRLAATFRPDAILILTDAEGLSLAQFKPALAPVGKTIPVHVAKVTAARVQPSQELR